MELFNAIMSVVSLVAFCFVAYRLIKTCHEVDDYTHKNRKD